MSARGGLFLSGRGPELLKADTLSFGVVGALAVVLFKAPLPPNVSEDIGDYLFADFDGASVLAAPTTGGIFGIDPLTGDFLVTLKDPAGGWRWIVATTLNLPQSIYGYGITDPLPSMIYATEAFDAPRALTAVGQEIVLGTVNVRFPAGYLGNS